MAFVFQSQRWKPQPQNYEPGPTYYNPIQKLKPTGGLIIPQHNVYINRNELSSQQQKLLITGMMQKKQRYHHQSSQKLFKRAQSAKFFKSIKPFASQQFQITPVIKKNNFQISNFISNQQETPIHLKKTAKSYKKLNKFSSSSSQLQLSNKQLFNDKNLKTKNIVMTPQTKENLSYFNSCLDKQQSNHNKTNIHKFVQNKSKTSAQNSFTANQNNFIPKKDQNFCIASGNCKKISIKHTKIFQNPQKQLSQFTKLDIFQDVQTTAIDDSYVQEDSFEYITNATPGPGQYELRNDKYTTKSRLQKFGITQKRFKQPKKQQTVLNLNANMPNFKKSSKASQQKVSFGKHRPQTAKQNTSDFLLYDDLQTIENKCIKNLIKDRTAPGTFLSKMNRFEKKQKQAYFGPDFFQKDKKGSITLPDSTYMSKVQRHQRSLSPTADVDFTGQDYKTIKNNIEILNQRKELFDNQAPGFHVSEPRFKYKTKQEGQQSIPKLNKNSQHNKKELKSYTFSRQQTKQKMQQNDSPAPWAYSTQMKWVKPSHHVRYKF